MATGILHGGILIKASWWEPVAGKVRAGYKELDVGGTAQFTTAVPCKRLGGVVQQKNHELVSCSHKRWWRQ